MFPVSAVVVYFFGKARVMMKGFHFMLVFLAAMSAQTPASGQPELLVLMHGSGKVERYNLESGTHTGTFISGLSAPNALLPGPDGRLYISTGLPGGLGTVERYDARTGRRIDTFIKNLANQPGYLARATGMAWYEGDLLVASQGDGKIKRFDGVTGTWKADVASAPPGALTQIVVHDGQLYMTDFTTPALRVSNMTGEAALADVYTAIPDQAPWGLVLDVNGHAFWSTNANRIVRYDGTANTEWVGAAGGLNMPVGLALGPDSLLYAANLGDQRVSVWKSDAPSGDAPVRIIGSSEMLSPISFAFLDVEENPTVQIGNFVEKPSNTGKNWTPDGTTIYNIRSWKSCAGIADFGLDTEGGDRAKLNLLKESISLRFTLKDGSLINSADLAASSTPGENRIQYAFTPLAGANAEWAIWLEGQNMKMRFALGGPQAAQVIKTELFIPFDPRAMGTTILAEDWGTTGAVKAPLIISALDMGQLRLSNADNDQRLDCHFTGSRLHKRIDLAVEVLSPSNQERTIVFEPVHLDNPGRGISDTEWARVRRGLISLLQVTPYMKPFEDGSPWLGSPGGILGNNVISDPVTCNMDRNLQWLNGMGDKATVMGINLNKVALKTIEFWLNNRMNANGSLDYVLQAGNISADSNTGVLNSATDYYLSTGDKQFVRDNKVVLLKAVNYLVTRDLDNDGLIETFRDGNGGNEFGDTGYDTVSSGWKNALVNGQAYKSFLGVAKMMEDIGEAKLADEYRQRALRLRQAYNKTFYEPATGRYIWWIGKDGKRHDYKFTLIQSNAVLFGIASCLNVDTGLARGDKDVMGTLWNDLEAAEYMDSAKGKKVDYIDSKTGNYTGFYWGIPGNLEDVPDDYNFSTYGSYEFPYYCNGGIFPQDTVSTIMAFAKAGMPDKAEIIKRQIFRRQHEGIFPNGSGFYMGVVNIPGQCYSILKWDGTPTDYEGIISRDCAFLQSVVLQADPAQPIFEEAAKMVPASESPVVKHQQDGNTGL